MWYGKFWWTYSALRLIFPDVCYKNDEVGCYNKEEPFAHFDILPNSPGPLGMDVKFKLYTRVNDKVPELLNNVLLDAKWIPKNYNPIKKTAFLIHGFNDNGNNPWMLEMKDSILQKEDINVVIVDWGIGAKSINYMIPASNTRTVGTYLGRLVSILVPDLSMVHIIGHSLGAHVAGFAGAWTEGKIMRITGLDPAGPLFDKYDPLARLDADDAVFVDVVHTDTEGVFNLGLGMNKRCGDIDFFPNGGEIQPGCNQSVLKIADSIARLQVEELHKLFPCSHERSIQLYTESILSDCKFLFCSCKKKAFLKDRCSKDNCTGMGYDVDTMFHGEFYGYTHSQTPYCITESMETTPSTPTLEVMYNTTAEQEPTEMQFNATLSLNGNVTENTFTERNTTFGSNLTITNN
ncbi:pancreatic triacylglycerol lipase-like [Ostrea edulis]|uniref:pancreatic triacylglycerol lipase-like n=1 Tax=Ostrea edulis TaxID=37623 RepID=UPI0024AF99F5|nr:pancreatic triacylglycerol lipase-like [Ostrea edulis]